MSASLRELPGSNLAGAEGNLVLCAPVLGPSKELTRTCREAFEKLCSDFSIQAEPLGFTRSKSTLWTRAHALTVDVLSFFREGSTYGAPISASVKVRVSLAIRALNDNSPGLTLNGPCTSHFVGQRPPGYHLSFNARSFSQYERCLGDIMRFVREQGLPWFADYTDPGALIERVDSPLSPQARLRLREALAGNSNAAAVAASRKLLRLRVGSKRSQGAV